MEDRDLNFQSDILISTVANRKMQVIGSFLPLLITGQTDFCNCAYARSFVLVSDVAESATLWKFSLVRESHYNNLGIP